MTLSNLAQKATKLAADNSPLILTAIGVAGTVSTAVLTGKASFKAAGILRDEADRRVLRGVDEPPMDARDVVSMVWREYVPAVGVGAVTVTCIIFANRIGTRRAAAIAAAYTLSQETISEYRDKVIEKLGENKERQIRDELAQEEVFRTPPPKNLVVLDELQVIAFERYTGRYFRSSMEEIKSAQNYVNFKINNGHCASLSDFYDHVGLTRTDVSEEVGWNLDNPCEITFSTVMTDDNRPALAFEYKVMPIRSYFRIH